MWIIIFEFLSASMTLLYEKFKHNQFAIIHSQTDHPALCPNSNAMSCNEYMAHKSFIHNLFG